MPPSGADFYDDERQFQAYMHHRSRPDSANETLEKPIFLALVGDVRGKRILDLGCGDAGFGLEALRGGCRSYCGVDGSRNMVAAARQTLTGTSGEIMHAPLEEWRGPAESFDLVVSRLVLHYLPKVQPVLNHVYQTLVEQGRLIFSVEHPIITSCSRGRHSSGVHYDWIVDEYFESGLRVVPWLGGEVRKYHRTVEEYFEAVQAAGLVIEHLRESRPAREHFQDEALYQRRKRIPLMLFLSARKDAP